MKLLVIGHTVEDIINTGSNVKRAPGGIFHAVIGLKNIIFPDDDIFLCTNIEDENYHLFKDVYENVNTVMTRKVDEIPKVHLKIFEHIERHEKYENITQSIEIDYSVLNQFDGILINMITGFDITIEQLEEIRKNFNGPIYFDVHTFSRGLGENYQREFRVIENFERWADNLDIIQANEKEIFSLLHSSDKSKIIKNILQHDVKFFIETKADSGAELYHLKNGDLNSEFRPAIKIFEKNKIGCGDVFGASFFYIYLKTNDKLKAFELANKAAGLVASYESFDEYTGLQKVLR